MKDNKITYNFQLETNERIGVTIQIELMED